jgi:hypothetical protein
MATGYLLIIFGQIILIFFLSRLTINELFYFLRVFYKKEKIIYSLVSFLFFPGTVIHEMAHFVTATILNLKVYEIRLFPQWEKNQIKLGSVFFEKKICKRYTGWGGAIFFGLIFFWFLAKFHLFPNSQLGLNILFGYIVFTVSSTMFSSNKYLIEFGLMFLF